MYYSKIISTGLIFESLTGPENSSKPFIAASDLGTIKSLRDSAEQIYPAEDIEVAEGTEEEIAAMIDAKQVAIDLANPMETWKRTMTKSDSSMPRYLEDHITDDHDGVASNEFLQVRYDDKKTLRATKPA